MRLLRGVDISAFQSSLVLDTVDDLDFAFVKATEGATYTSSRFAAQWASAKKRARHRGAYHFARPEASSCTDQTKRFLDVVQPAAGESVWLDLEASKLNQAGTNAWARGWGEYMGEHAPGVSGLYIGSGYAINNTGKGLAEHFAYWWYPQYPSVYQLTPGGPGIEDLRARNRSSTVPGRVPISSLMNRWPPKVDPWLPPAAGQTGWTAPHIWQFTDHFGPGLDANITALTLDQLAGTGGHEEDDMGYAQAGVPPLKVGERHSYKCPRGAINIWGMWFDSPHKLTYRISAHSAAGGGAVKADLVVGGAASSADSWPHAPSWKTKLADVDAFSIELVKAEGPAADWDPTMAGADGRTVRPGWDASHTS